MDGASGEASTSASACTFPTILHSLHRHELHRCDSRAHRTEEVSDSNPSDEALVTNSSEPPANGESARTLAACLRQKTGKGPLTWSPRGDSNPRPADYEPAPLCVCR